MVPMFVNDNDVNAPPVKNFWVLFILPWELVIFEWQKDYLINFHYKLINLSEYNTKPAGIKKQMKWVLKTIFEKH